MGLTLRDNIYVILRHSRNKIQDVVSYIVRRVSIFRYTITHSDEKRITRNNIYLVYTMGKVASLSVLDSITQRLPYIDCFAMHYLTQKNLQAQEMLLFESGVLGNMMHKDIHTRHAEKILRCIENNPDKRIKIITIVREPLSQAISQIFQHLNLYDINSLKHLTLESDNIDYSYAESWCQEELCSFSGVDILKQPFDKERGYSIYSNDKCDLLVIKFDVINSVFGEAMTALSNVPNWRLSRVNISSKKQYSQEYRNFKLELTVEQQLVEFLYQSHYMNHFYTEDEIAKLSRKWRVVG